MTTKKRFTTAIGTINGEGIEKIVNNSDSFLYRALIYFKNGWRLSVISGEHARSDKERPYEVAAWYGEGGSLDVTILGSPGESVIGYRTAEEVIEYVETLAKAKTEEDY